MAEFPRGAVLIAAGGTGGHVFPALAVAQQLRDSGQAVVWLGTRRGIESRLVEEQGFPLHYIQVVGLRGKGLLHWLKAPLLMVGALFSVVRLIWQCRPCCVLGMGGFVSAAAGIAAIITARPLLLQEQNAVAGTTNKLLAPLARKIFVGFPTAFSTRDSQVYCGNPLRESFSSIADPAQRLSTTESRRILVLGGSLGARGLNETVPLALAELGDAETISVEVLHQSGRTDNEAVAACYQQAGITAKVEPFIDDMAAAYSRADLVIARAGGLTVAELSAVGVAALLVPYPHAVDDHQNANADWLVEGGAALKIQQCELTVDRLAATLRDLLRDKEQLLARALRARSLAKPTAAAVVAGACREYACV